MRVLSFELFLHVANCICAKYILVVCRSFAGEALERERFGADVVASYHSGVGFAKAKANVESLNRCVHAAGQSINEPLLTLLNAADVVCCDV